jgi:NADPH2:quinone reductase
VRAVTFADQQVVVADRPDPRPGTGQALVAVRAAGLNGADLLQRAGLYDPPPGSPDVPGLEFAGEVVEVGDGTRDVAVGDRVMAIAGGGGQATRITAHERMLLPVPDDVAWAAAGGFMETFTTAHDALFTQAGLEPGERVLVNGANGGVGTSAVQLAVAAGATVVASARSRSTHDGLTAMGAHEVVTPSEAHDHGPFDVVLELVGAPNMAANLSSLAPWGRVCVIGVGGGPTVELNLLALMGRRGRIHGSTLRARPLEEKIDASRAVLRHVVPLLASGRVTVPIEAAHDLEDAAAAYEAFRAPGKVGKVVLTTG